MSKRRLGKGIDALLQGRDLSQLEQENATVLNVPLVRLRPNPDQPRKQFDTAALDELARSIEERGIIQPILAEEQPDGSYLIIAGERRYRAAKLAGLTVVPVLAGVFSEDEKLEIALIENIQRQDLNPIEEALAYQELLVRTGVGQEELARRLGRSRPALANSMRLLKLPETVREAVIEKRLSAGHARALLALDEPVAIERAAALVVEEELNVRATERLVSLVGQAGSVDAALAQLHSTRDSGASGPDGNALGATDGMSDAGVDRAASNADDGTPAAGIGSAEDGPGSAGAPGGAPPKSVELRAFEQQLIERLGTRVNINGSHHRGRLEIAYLSMDDLERVVELILGAERA